MHRTFCGFNATMQGSTALGGRETRTLHTHALHESSKMHRIPLSSPEAQCISTHTSRHCGRWKRKRHLAKLLVQFPNTQVGLGDKVLSSKGQLSLMQAKVSSTVSPNKVAAAFSCSPRNIVAGAALTMQASLSVPAKAEGESLTSEEPKSCFTRDASG